MQFDPQSTLDAVKPFTPSIMGALLGLLHNRDKPPIERLVAVLTGMVVAHFAGSGLVAYFDMTHVAIVDSVKFALGLFGMSIVHSMYEQIGPFWQSVRERAVALIGGGK
jgi:hypothetical protein